MLMTVACVVLPVLGLEGLTVQVSRLLSLTLPLTSAALFSIILTLEFLVALREYQEMTVFLENKIKRSKTVRTWMG